MDVLILLPVLDDWISVEELLKRIDSAFAASTHSVAVLLVDDGSTMAVPAAFASGPYQKLSEVGVLELKKNLGNQRALAVGLCHLAVKRTCEVIVIMDGDGEDEPADALRLLARLESLPQASVVFAERTRRSESLLFRSCYLAYRLLHFVLTGRRIRVGNFSAIPVSLLPALTIEPMLWNHFAASIVRSRLRVETVPTQRGVRIDGKSRLPFVGLVIHGLSALACYNETIGVRIFLALSGLSFLALLGLIAIVGLKLFTSLAIPGWSSILVVLIIVLLLQVAGLVSNFVMQAISTRSMQPFLPIRDYAWFISGEKRLYPARRP
jgi:hypothetical protein